MPTVNRPLVLGLAAGLSLALGAPGPTRAQSLPTEGYRLVATWRTTAPPSSIPPLERPLDLDVAPDDQTIYLVDGRRNQVHHLTSGGEGRATWDAANHNIGTLVDVAVSTNRVYLLGANAGSIHNRDGTFIKTWAVTGGRGIAFGPDRRVYVSRVSQGNGSIDVFDVDGNRLETWRDPGFPILTAYGLDVAGDGRVYLAADGGVYTFVSDGAGGGRVTGLLRVPRAIEGAVVPDVVVDPSGRVFATVDTGWVVTWNGATPQQRGLNGVKRVAVGPGGGLLVSIDDGSFKGLGYFTDRRDLTPDPILWGPRNDDALGRLEGPRRVALAPGNTAFLLDRIPRVQRWTTDGQPRDQWVVTDYMADVAGGADRPCVTNGRALRCIVSNTASDWWIDIPLTGWLTALDGDASRLAALDLADQKVWLYRRDKSLEDSWPIADDDPTFHTVSDVALGPDAVYLADQGGARIDIRALDGSPRDTLDLPTGPVRLAVAAGDVYVLGRDGWIWKYGADKRLKAVWQPAVDGTPNDLAADAAGRVYVSDPANDRVLVFEPGGPPPASVPEPPDERCLVTVDKRAAPPIVVQRELATVQLAVRGACPLGDGRLDVVLVVDQSGSMQGSPMAAAQAAGLAFVNELKPGAAHVAVVGFSTTAEVLQTMTGDLGAVVRAVARLAPAGQTNYQDALDKALAEATGPGARRDVPRVVVMMTDGKPTNRAGVEQKADALKAAGVTLFTIGFGTTVDADLLRAMATTPDLYFDAPSEAELADVYREIARRITAVRLLKQATVTDELPDDMRYEEGSAVPPARLSGRTLTWELSDVPATGRTLSYRVRPQRLGVRPTNVQAVLDYVDASDEPGRLTFPVPEIEVVRPNVWFGYLPILYKNRCQPQRADVVLVIDTSSSMTGPERPGSPTTKLAAALRAARNFVAAMELPGDQAAVVAFNGSASVVEPLTGSRAALNFALGSLPTAAGTRIDLGLSAATNELLSARHKRLNNPVVVLLTDGQPSSGTVSQVLDAARSARGLGFTVFAVGFGDDADMALLQRVSGRADRTFYAPDAASLAAIYDRIAGKVLCEP